LKAPCGTVLDVRTSAHLHPTEVGCHICPMHIVPRERSPYKTVKLTLTSSGPKPLASRYASFVHRNEPNRPHISSVIQQCQRAYQNTNTTGSAKSLAPTARLISWFLAEPASPPLR
jgi:hypothetical protein